MIYLLDTLRAAAGSRPVQRRVTVLIREVGVGLGEQQQVDDVCMAFDRGPMQRRIAVAVNLKHP